MNENKFVNALLAALVVGVATPVIAATVVAPGTSGDSVNKSLSVADGTAVQSVETVNGSIEVGSGATANSVETVNGSVKVGNDVSVESLETVNGSVVAGSNLKVKGNVETVNGRIEIASGGSIEGSVETVNGKVSLDNVSVAQNVETVNGGLDFKASRIGGNVEMVNGRIDLAAATIVAGDLVVAKNKSFGWSWGSKPKPPVVVIGEGSEVRGRILIENEATKLYVHQNARIGEVVGVTAQRFSAEAPE